MTRTLKLFLLLVGVVGFFAVGCKKDKTPPTVPSITTAAATDVTTTTAKSGGTITDNGRAAITEAGVVYSSTNPTPTVTDTKKTATATSGSFTVDLTGLNSGSTYYVRAYATNSVGTAYGQVVQFNTGNAAPEARIITIVGTKAVDEKLTARYTYFDAENDPESGTSFQWYIANDTIGATVTTISGATDSVYKIVAGDQSKFLRVGITAKSSAGTSPGAEVKSAWVGPIGSAATTVTFTYNGQTVTYGIITSTVTQRKWLDRNLGAPSTPTAYNDYANYGDLFQWGRLADGHQLINRAASTSGTTGVNGTSTVLSSSNNPNTSLFIITSNQIPYDWRTPQNENLWQGSNGINNPCPSGWHVPTTTEWEAEMLTSSLPDAFTQLKLTAGGYRTGSSGGFSLTSLAGFYWSSTTLQNAQFNSSVTFIFGLSGDPKIDAIRSAGQSVRCIKD